MTTIMNQLTDSRAERNRLAAEKILPNYAPFGIHYLKDREAIAAWAKRGWDPACTVEDLPGTLRWAVGIDNCNHLRLEDGHLCASSACGRPGLFSLSERGSFLQWKPGESQPVRLLGQPAQTDMHFLQFVTQNGGHENTPVFTHLFTKFSEEFCDNWSFAQLEALRA